MKKYLCLIALSLVLVSCGKKEIDSSKLQNRNGIFYEVNQQKGFTGKAVSKYSNGQIKEEFSFKNGKPNGIFKVYYENGQLKEEGSYKDSKLNGSYKKYYENGHISYKDGVSFLLDGTLYSDLSQPFSDGLAVVEIGGKYGFIDKSGNLVIPAKFDKAWEFSDGLANVEIDGKWGFIDKSGNLVIPAKFDYTWGFSDGLALVEINGKWIYIDKKGKALGQK
ncbi:MAG: WG repeat-containing protein [Fusobacteriaceae bacterium]